MTLEATSAKAKAHILLAYGLVGRGGDAVQTMDLAAAFQNLGHRVYLVGPQVLRPYEFAGKSSQLRSWLRQRPWWVKDIIDLGLSSLTFFKACCLLRHHKVDLIFDRAGIYGFVGTGLVANVHCPLVVYLDTPFPLERAFRREGYFRRLHHLTMRRIGQTAQLIVTVSRPARDYFVEVGIPYDKIVVQPNGFPRQLLEQAQKLTKLHRPFAKGQPYTIGFVGSLARWHRVDLMLEALHLVLLRNAAKFRLTVVGYGEDYEHLVKLAYELGLEGQVRWLGPLPHDQAFAQIAQFDIAILPDTLPIGSPMKLFEYAALARPIIVPDLPNIRDLFTEDEVFFIQPENAQALADALLELVDNPDRAIEMGKRVQELIRKYTWEDQMKVLMKRLGLETFSENSDES